MIKNPADNLKDRLMKLGGIARRDNMYKLVLEKGDVYESATLTPREIEFIRDAAASSICAFKPKECFSNSQLFMLAVQNIKDMYPDMSATYIEGFFALSDLPIPIHHGWVSLNGKVVDLTITQDAYTAPVDGFEDRVIGQIPEDFEYVGIPIETMDVLYRITDHQEAYNFLDDRRPHMRDLRAKYFRRNPMTTLDDLRAYMEAATDDGRSDEEFFEYATNYYRDSLLKPDKFRREHPERAGYQFLSAGRFMWIGPKGRMLKVYAEDVQPIEGNIFYFEKLRGLSVAPRFVGGSIPLYVGYVDPWLMTENVYEEAVDYEDEYYEPDEDDIGEIFFQLRDGNHRTVAALLSGAPYAYAQIDNNTYQDYRKWIDAGRPDDVHRLQVFEYLDDNLV